MLYGSFGIRRRVLNNFADRSLDPTAINRTEFLYLVETPSCRML